MAKSKQEMSTICQSIYHKGIINVLYSYRTLLNKWVRFYHINNTKSYKHILAITTFF